MVWLRIVALATFLHVIAIAANGVKGQDFSSKANTNMEFPIQTLQFDESQIARDRDAHERKLTKSRIAAEKARLQRLIGEISEEDEDGGKWFELNKKACIPARLPKRAFLEKEKDFAKPLTSKLIEDFPERKYLLFIARQGLGNTIAGFSSAFVFSLLSGRRLVVLLGDPENQAFDVLCDAFNCNPNVVVFDEKKLLGDSFENLRHWKLTHGSWWKHGHGGEKSMKKQFFSEVPVMVIKSDRNFDHYWFPDEILKTCVFQSLQCETLNCVYLRAIRFLITGGPKKILQDVIEENIKGAEGNNIAPIIPHGSHLKMRFDVSIHIRTVNRIVEKQMKNKACKDCLNRSNGTCALIKNFCENLEKKRKEGDEIREQLFLESTFWKCLGNFFRRLKSKLISKNNLHPTLSVFLATDSEKLRPKFVEIVGKHSVCYFSSGTVQHTYKDRGSINLKLPTLAEFYLLSRARFVLAFSTESFVSTFAREAAYYGNSTLVLFDPKRKKTCRFVSCNDTISLTSSGCKVDSIE